MSDASSEPAAPPAESARRGEPTVDDVLADASRARARDRELGDRPDDDEGPGEPDGPASA